MTTADALLAAVLAHPDDDLPRLVYADYLEETGHTLRAEFIRLQCHLAAEPHPQEAARIREHALLHTHARSWLAPLRAIGEPLAGRRTHALFHRGFVETVWMPAGVFAATAERLFSLCPVREVRFLLDQRPGGFERAMGCTRLAGVVAVDVSDGRFGVRGARAVAESRHLGGLRALRLAGCNLDDVAVTALCDSRLSLTELDVRHNPLSDGARERLRARFGAAVHC